MCMTFTVAKVKPVLTTGQQDDVPEMRGGGWGEYSHILAIRVCAAGKGI